MSNNIIIGYNADYNRITRALQRDGWEFLGVSFKKYCNLLYHRGHLIEELTETRYRAFANYRSRDRVTKSGAPRRLTVPTSLQGWTLYEWEWRDSGTIAVTPIRGSRNSKPETYIVDLNSCSCPVHRHSTGGLDDRNRCKHQRMMWPELSKAPWLENSIYAYPTSQPEPNASTTTAPKFSLHPGDRIGQYFWVEQESNDRGWSLKLMCLTQDARGKTPQLLGYIQEKEGWLHYTSPRGLTNYPSCIASWENLEKVVCTNLLTRSGWQKWLIPLEPLSQIQEEPTPQNLAPAFNLKQKRVLIVQRGAGNIYRICENNKIISTANSKIELNNLTADYLRKGCVVKGQSLETGKWFEAYLNNGQVNYREISASA